MPKKKSQHDVLREIFAKEGTTLPLNEIAKKLGTTPVSARAAMATLRNPKRQVTPFVITRVPGTQDYGRGKKAMPKKKKATTGKRKPKDRGGATIDSAMADA